MDTKDKKITYDGYSLTYVVQVKQYGKDNSEVWIDKAIRACEDCAKLAFKEVRKKYENVSSCRLIMREETIIQGD